MSNSVNFGNVANDYAKFRDDIPAIIFEQLNKRNIEFSGKEVIDLGSGTGIFSRALDKQGAKVTGIEPEASLINQAIQLDKLHNSQIKYVCSSAETIALPDKSYDMVTALRAWHWFDRNIVNEQVMRVLKDEGYLIVIHSIFVPQLSPIAHETIQIIRECIGDLKPAGSMGEVTERRTGFPANWFAEWEQMGFKHVDEWQHDYTLTFTKEEWCGKVRSLSWLTNESEELKGRIVNKIMAYVEPFEHQLKIPHRYSVVVLKKV